MIKSKIIIVDDDKDVLNALRILLKREFSEIHFVSNPNLLHTTIEETNPSVILLDMNFKAGVQTGNEGIFWMKEIHKLHKHCSVVMLTAYGEINLAVKAMKEGAVDFATKPWNNEKLIATLKAATELNKAKIKATELQSQQENLNKNINANNPNIIGKSNAINQVHEIIKKVAKTDTNILILGENGTGKELVAREIHKQSQRAKEIFLSIDMTSLSESLFESELFGYTKGAFTDAKTDKIGRFKMANRGTLFLDEIGNLSFNMQAKILTAIQNKTITPLGANQSIPFNSRIISATNKNLEALISEDSFREDLYFRINTITIKVPPLRERGDDILILAAHFLDYYSRKYAKPSLSFSDESIQFLVKYQWPGNIRELKHAIEKAVILTDSQIISPDSLFPSQTNLQNNYAYMNQAVTLDEMEAIAIKNAIIRHNGVMSRVAKELGITRATLYKKTKKYGL